MICVILAAVYQKVVWVLENRVFTELIGECVGKMFEARMKSPLIDEFPHNSIGLILIDCCSIFLYGTRCFRIKLICMLCPSGIKHIKTLVRSNDFHQFTFSILMS